MRNLFDALTFFFFIVSTTNAIFSWGDRLVKWGYSEVGNFFATFCSIWCVVYFFLYLCREDGAETPKDSLKRAVAEEEENVQTEYSFLGFKVKRDVQKIIRYKIFPFLLIVFSPIWLQNFLFFAGVKSKGFSIDYPKNGEIILRNPVILRGRGSHEVLKYFLFKNEIGTKTISVIGSVSIDSSGSWAVPIGSLKNGEYQILAAEIGKESVPTSQTLLALPEGVKIEGRIEFSVKTE